jgi:DNA-binding MarR family transcriptional regulator
MDAVSDRNEQLMCINLQMLRASHVVLKTYDDAYRPYGIRATQLPVLNLIAQRGPVTIKVIADETESERSVLSRKLQVMEKHGWIAREGIPGSREQAYSLSEEGKALLDKIKPVRMQVQNELMGRLDESERQLLLGLCDKLRS